MEGAQPGDSSTPQMSNVVRVFRQSMRVSSMFSSLRSCAYLLWLRHTTSEGPLKSFIHAPNFHPHPTPTHADSAHVLWPCAVSSWLFAVASGRMQRAKSTRCFWIIICQADKDKSSLERFQHTLSEAIWVIHFGFIWYFCLRSVTFRACYTGTLSSLIASTLEAGAVQAFLVPCDYADDLPSEWWSQALGFDVLLVTNWLDVFANIGTESQHPMFVETFQVISPACLGFTLWCPFATSKFFQNRIFQNLIFKDLRIFGLGHRAPKRQWTSQPVSCSSWRRRGKHSRGSESAAQRSVSLDFNVGVRSLSAGSHARIECKFYEILCMVFAPCAWNSSRNPL